MPLATDSEGNINVSIRCLGCGYNLRTLSSDANCPECGRAVAEALDPRLLRFAPARWLHRVRLGFLMILWGCALAAGVFLLAYVPLILRPSAARGWEDWLVAGVSLVVVFFSPVICLVGVLFATARRPGHDTHSRAAAAARLFAGAALLLLGLELVLRVLPLWATPGITPRLVLALCFLSAAAALAACLYLLAPLIRVCDPRVARSATRSARGIVGLMLLSIAAIALRSVQIGGGQFRLGSILAGLVVLAGVVMVINLTLLLFRATGALRAVAAEAAEREAG